MNKNFVFLTVFLASVFAGCSSDEPTAPEDRFDETYDGQAYMRVRISMADDATSRSTTDGGFEYGSTDEQAIKEIGLKFYSADGSFYGYGMPVNDPNSTVVTPSTTKPDTYVEGEVADAVIVLQINSNAPKPTHVVAFVNCGDAWKLTPEPAINEIDAIMQNKITTTYDGKEYYAMTSSNYVIDNVGSENFVQGYQTSVDPNSFKPTEGEAKAEHAPVEIHVERLAAKVKVGMATGKEPNEIVNGDYTLKFVIDGYALGGVNNNSYYVKHLNRYWNDASLWPGWNSPVSHRCYWAADMNYYEINAAPALHYVSYNSISDKLTLSKTSWLYSAENTQTSFLSENPQTNQDVQAAPRLTAEDVNRYLFNEFVYVIGHYEVTKDGNSVKDDYLYEYAGKILTNDVMLRYMQQTLGNVIFERHKDSEDAAAYYTSVDMVEKGWLKIGRYGNDASLVCLQLTATATLDELKKFYIKKQNANAHDASDSDYTQISELNDVIDLLKQSTVHAYGFKYHTNCANTGKAGYLAYFPILIQHLNTKSVSDGGGATFGENSRGYYGVVRNHCYKITINKITGLGIGIYDPTVDIIPKDKVKPLYLAAEFKVLSWKVVNQSVDL